MADQFLVPIPQAFLKDPEVAEWARTLTLFLDNLSKPDGTISVVDSTAEVVLTQQEKLDLMTVSQDVNLDTMEADTVSNKAAIELIATSSPDYNLSNDGTVRTINADAAAGAISVGYTQAEIENLRDAILVQGDVICTIIRDFEDKDIFSV